MRGEKVTINQWPPITTRSSPSSSSHPLPKGHYTISRLNAKTSAASTLPILASTSKSISPPTSTNRRKRPLRQLPPDAAHLASLVPHLGQIVQRCLTKSTLIPSPPTTASHSKVKLKPLPPRVQPYSRSTDLANTRSLNPSPREIERAKKMEEERRQARIEGAAIARLKRKRGNGRGKSGNSKDVSPNKDDPIQLQLQIPSTNIPKIVTEPASAESTPHLPRIGLKRTRSHGVMPIATGLANTFGNGNIGVGSPLKAVMGPEDDDYEKDGPKKRSRLYIYEAENNIPNGENKAKSKSPQNPTRKLPTRAKTVSPPSRTTSLPPSKGSKSDTLALSSRKALLGGNGKGTSTDMRRAVSSGGAVVGLGIGVGVDGGVGARRASAGSDGDGGMGRGRREVILPGRLRDFEVAGGIW